MPGNNYPPSESIGPASGGDTPQYSSHSSSTQQVYSSAYPSPRFNSIETTSQTLPSPSVLFGGPVPQGFPPGFSPPYAAQPYPSSHSSYHIYPHSSLHPLSIGRPAEYSQYPSPDSPKAGKASCVLPPPNSITPFPMLSSSDQNQGDLPGFLPPLGKSYMALPPLGPPRMTEGSPLEDPGIGNQHSHHNQYDYSSGQKPSRSSSDGGLTGGIKRERERDSHASKEEDQEKSLPRKKSRGTSFSSHNFKHSVIPLTKVEASPEIQPSLIQYKVDDYHRHNLGSSSPRNTHTDLSFRRWSLPSNPSEFRAKENPFRCEDCGRCFSFSVDLYEHRWEHSHNWKEVEKMVDLSRHQQVQIMEAAQILVEMASMSVNS